MIPFVTQISVATWRLTALLQARTAQMEQSLDHVSGVLRATLRRWQLQAGSLYQGFK